MQGALFFLNFWYNNNDRENSLFVNLSEDSLEKNKQDNRATPVNNKQVNRVRAPVLCRTDKHNEFYCGGYKISKQPHLE